MASISVSWTKGGNRFFLVRWDKTGTKLVTPTGAEVVPGGGGGTAIAVKDEGAAVTASASSMNFVGGAVAISSDAAGNVTITLNAVTTQELAQALSISPGHLALGGPDVSTEGDSGFEITLRGGNNTNATDGYGGSIYIQGGGGTGKVPGSVMISGGGDSSEASVTAGTVGGHAALGFFAADPVNKPSVTGAKGGNAALTSLLTSLASLGLITNATS